MKRGTALLAASLAFGIPGSSFAAAEFEFIYSFDQKNEVGFYDPTPVQPVGRNTGATLGEQRRIAFEFAASIWADALTSEVPIAIQASFTSLGCEADDGVTLGYAFPYDFQLMERNIAGESKELWHVNALANALAGEDLDRGDAAFNTFGADIFADFNSDLDGDCDFKWYYGIDGEPPRPYEQTDFLMIALHELGHGLGFLSMARLEEDSELEYLATIFEEFAFDRTKGTSWSEMSESQRLDSVRNARDVVWDGPHVTAAAADFLEQGSPEVTIEPPLPGFTGILSPQSIGPQLRDQSVSGLLVLPAPATGCEVAGNADELQGSIALIDPGLDCEDGHAIRNMQEAGAAGALLVDYLPLAAGLEDFRPPLQVLDVVEGQTLPVVRITRPDAALLASEGVGRTVSMGSANQLTGADGDGRVLLYASDPVLPGSTASHWDPLAQMNLLMEPFAEPEVAGLDLTRAFMQDIGWPTCADGVLQAPEACDDGNITEGDGCGSTCAIEVCGDGIVNRVEEECDDGNSRAGDGCTPQCKDEFCGDGTVNDTDEQCDDGNTDSGDGCSSSCETESADPASGGAAGATATPASSSDSDSGCGCRVAPTRTTSAWLMALVAAVSLVRRRRGAIRS